MTIAVTISDHSATIRGDLPDSCLACCDNLPLLCAMPDDSIDLVYIDPPFMTNATRRESGGNSFPDRWAGGVAEYIAFLEPRIRQMLRVLTERGTIYVHVDWRASHHVRLMLDNVFGAGNFLNEIIWTYRTGGLSRRWFARKHDTIFAYAKASGKHTFNIHRGGQFRTDGMKTDDQGRPFKSTRKGPLYFHPEGPALTDVWDIPFLSTVSSERVGYPSQKPEALLERIIRASSNPGDRVADFFCGSGTTLAVAMRLDRRIVGCDVSPEAMAVTAKRLDAINSSTQSQ